MYENEGKGPCALFLLNFKPHDFSVPVASWFHFGEFNPLALWLCDNKETNEQGRELGDLLLILIGMRFD